MRVQCADLVLDAQYALIHCQQSLVYAEAPNAVESTYVLVKFQTNDNKRADDTTERSSRLIDATQKIKDYRG
jgi:hypothetical protein